MAQRHFTFSDGKSDKFWQIEVEGEGFSVQYGKTGTTGQTQSKSFGSNDEAQKAADKLIAEKVKKGYVETTTGENGAAATLPAPQPVPKATAKSAAKAAPEAENADAKNANAEPGKEADAPPATTTFSASEPRQLQLEPRDWLWATWRPREIETRVVGKIKPFDKDEALARLAKVPGKSYWSPHWDKARIAADLSREEAHFWFAAMTLQMSYNSGGYAALFHGEMAKKIAPRNFDGHVTREQVVKALSGGGTALQNIDTTLISVLLNLFPMRDLIGIWLEADAQSRSQDKRNYGALGLIETASTAFQQHILPFLSEAEVAELRDLLRPEIAPSAWPTDFYEVPKIAFHLAAQLGMHAELLNVVKTWKDDFYRGSDSAWHDHYHRPQEIVFGLGSAAEVEAQMRRLKLRLDKPDWVRAWLACTEFSAPDWVVSSILGATGENYRNGAKDVAEALTKTFALAQAPEIAPAMLQLLLESKAPRAARQWLDDNPAHTISGLLPVAAGRGKLAEAAVEQLRGLKKRGAESALREAAASLSAEEQARVKTAVLSWSEKHFEPFSDADTPESLREALQSDVKLGRAKVSWISAPDLPPITFGDRRLNDAQVEALLTALRTPKHALTRAVKSSADRASLDAFAWKLFERWLGESAPSKENWAMLALGELGGDACALKLTPLVREWPGQAQHIRAVIGLGCLRQIGTDTALMQINGIAQKVKFKGLQGKAVEAMEGIAADRGFSRAQLEDRVVPTLDLDENGTRIFDFGPRQFRVVLSPEMKPLVREVGSEMGKPRPDLPKPSAKDDASQAEAALAEWRLLKKQLSEAVKIQAVRLENAMVRGRRWTPDEFEMLLAKHPLMLNLVRLLVWEAASGNRRATFRVTEDGSYADQNDEPWDLTQGEWAHIGIAHPLHLSEAERGAWGEIFSDYEIVPPFPQLGRAIYGLEEGEASGKEITRFKSIAVPPETLNFGLEKLDWQVGGLHDHGDYYQHSKSFEAAGVTAWVSYEPGLFKGYREGWEPQKMVRCFFLPSDYESKMYDDADEKQALLLGEIDAVAVSEVLKDLSAIAAKGEEKV